MNLEKIVHKARNLKYAVPLAVSLFVAKAEGQIYNNWNAYPAPPGITKIDPFKARGTIERVIEYNSTRTKEERDYIHQERATEDWIHTKMKDLTNWSCITATQQYIFNATYLGEDVRIIGQPVYNGNKELTTEALIRDKGSLGTYGSLGIPSLVFTLKDNTTIPEGHEMSVSFTGDSITGNSSKLTEPETGHNVQPGQEYVPMNCKEVKIFYPYVGKSWDDLRENDYRLLMIAYGTIKDGKLTILELNPNLKGILVETREQSNGIENRISDTYKLSMYPNPFSNQFTISDNIQRPEDVTITTMTGQVIYHTTKTEGTMTITDPKVTTQPAGMYILRVGNQAKKVVIDYSPKN